MYSRFACALVFVVPSTLCAASVIDPVLLPNPNRIAVGDIGAIEGGAVVARASDGAATYYNPAGLVRALHPSISGNAQLYEATKTEYSTAGGDSQSTALNIVPSYIGAVGWMDSSDHPKIVWGLAIVNPVSWKSVVDADINDPANDIVIRNHAQAEISTLAPTLGLGVVVNPEWSLGVSLQGLYTTQTHTQNEQEQQLAVGAWRNVSVVNERTILQTRLAVGTYWNITENLTFGAQIRSPTMLIQGSRKTRYDDLIVIATGPQAGATNTTGRLEGTHADLKRPFEVCVGLAYTNQTWSLEADVSARAAISTYKTSKDSIALEQTHMTTTTGAISVVEMLSAGAEMSDRAVVNAALGGSYRLNQTWTLHTGFFSDRSSVEKSTLYQDLDLYGATAGVSYTGKHSSVSLGAAYTWSGPNDVGRSYNPYTGQTESSTVEVQLLGFVLGTKYWF